jgi:hypothetical protein
VVRAQGEAAEALRKRVEGADVASIHGVTA